MSKATSDPDLASQRYRLLIQQLAAEDRGVRGYKAKIAKTLGVHPSYVTRVEAGGQRVGLRSIELAVQRLGIRQTFFTERLSEEPHYRDYLAPEHASASADDVEVQVMGALAGMDEHARERVLAWAEARWRR